MKSRALSKKSNRSSSTVDCQHRPDNSIPTDACKPEDHPIVDVLHCATVTRHVHPRIFDDQVDFVPGFAEETVLLKRLPTELYLGKQSRQTNAVILAS